MHDVIFVEVVLKFLIADLVSLFVFTILLGMFLNRIVSEVNVHVGSSFQGELG